MSRGTVRCCCTVISLTTLTDRNILTCIRINVKGRTRSYWPFPLYWLRWRLRLLCLGAVKFDTGSSIALAIYEEETSHILGRFGRWQSGLDKLQGPFQVVLLFIMMNIIGSYLCTFQHGPHISWTHSRMNVSKILKSNQLRVASANRCFKKGTDKKKK